MPVMDGFEAASHIRRLPAHTLTPIVAVTAAVMDNDRIRCTDSGMNYFLSKPITLSSVKDLLTSAGVL
jgi:CheY-like chemotaxis protein